MKLLLFFLSTAILLGATVSFAADSTKLAPPTITAVKKGYTLSTGSYQTRCHWAQANSSYSNRGEASCRNQTISNSLCENGYTPFVSTAVNAFTGHDGSYFDSVVVDPNPVLGVNGNTYTLSYWNGNGTYLDAKALWHHDDDGFVTIRYTVYCLPQ